jgi:hypothetical protein
MVFSLRFSKPLIGFRCAMSRVGPKADRKNHPEINFLYHKKALD